MADCEQPTRAPTKLRFRQFQRFILSRLTVGAQIGHGNPPFLRLTAEFERSEKPATSSERDPSPLHQVARRAQTFAVQQLLFDVVGNLGGWFHHFQ
jgi:hypothetical protein